MIKKSIIPAELFETIGQTIGEAVTNNNEQKRYRISKIGMEVQMELSPDLKTIKLPSNEQKILDKKQPINLFKVSVTAR